MLHAKLKSFYCCYQLLFTSHVTAWTALFTVQFDVLFPRLSNAILYCYTRFGPCSPTNSGDFVIFHHNAVCTSNAEEICTYAIFGWEAWYITALPVLTAVSFSPHEAVLQHTMPCLLSTASVPLWPKHVLSPV